MFTKVVSVGVWMVFLSLTTGSSLNLPKGFLVCRRSDPELEECLAGAIKNGIQLLRNGNKELGLYTLDPMKIEELVLQQQKQYHEAFRLNMKLTNVTFTNHSNIEITVTRANAEHLDFKVRTYSPLSSLSGHYEMKGQMILLPVRGSGSVQMEFKGLTASLHMKLEPVKKHNGTVYLKPTQIKYMLQSFENIHVNFQNLFKGNKALSDTINKALNDNWEGIIETFKPTINTLFSSIMSDIIVRVFAKVPYDEILPP